MTVTERVNGALDTIAYYMDQRNTFTTERIDPESLRYQCTCLNAPLNIYFVRSAVLTMSSALNLEESFPSDGLVDRSTDLRWNLPLSRP
jgi:hypothetical protein